MMRILKPNLIIVFTLGAFLQSVAQGTNTAPFLNLGNKLPGQSPERFAPGSAYLATNAWWWMSAPTFSPEGKELFFCKYFPDGPHEVWLSSFENEGWKEPIKAWFSETDFTASPRFSPDGESLYFYAEGRPGGVVFRMRRQGNAWSVPEPCLIPLPTGKVLGQNFHVAANGNLYISMLNSDRDWTSAKLCVSRQASDVYTIPEELPGEINTGSASELVSWVAPDESYIFFSSSRSGGRGEHDIYVSVRASGGNWGPAVAISFLNTYQEDNELCISPDGDVAFFTTARRGDRGYSAYWFDAKALDAFFQK